MAALIAEIGLNHLGDVSRAWRTLNGVLEAGANSVTFQIREPKFYETTNSSKRRLPEEFYREAAIAAHKAGCQFGIATCDESLVEGLAAIGVDFWKTLSWDFRNERLQAILRGTGRPVFMSTGLSGMKDVVEGSRGLDNVVLIHTQLSQKIADVNLKAIPAMVRETGLPVAFGLHCSNQDVLKAAVAFEPHSMFFYVKESGVEGMLDDAHALPLDGLAETLHSLRELMQALGTGKKEEMKRPGSVK